MPRPPAGGAGRRGGGRRGGGGGGGGGGAGGGGGVRIGGIYATADLDTSGFEEGVETLNAAGQVAAQRQSAYIQAIQERWREAGRQGNTSAQEFLEVAQAVMRMGGSFETASQAVNLATRGSVEAREAFRDLRAQVEGLGNAQEAVTRRRTGGGGGPRREEGAVFQDARGRYMQQTARGPRFITQQAGELAAGRAVPAAEAEEAAGGRQANFEQRIRRSTLESLERRRIRTQVLREQGEPVPGERAAEGAGDEFQGRQRRGGVQGFVAANQTAIRLGAGLLGIPLGINIIAGAARDLHTVIAGMSDAFQRFDTSVHQLGVEFGAAAVQQQAFNASVGQQQGIDPTYLNNAATAVGRLTQAYQLTGAQISAVTEQARTLVAINNVPQAQTEQMATRLTQALSQGGAVPELNVDLSNQYLTRVRGINLEAQTPEQQFATRQAELQRQLRQQESNQTAAGQTPGQGTPEYTAEQRRQTALSNAGRGGGEVITDIAAGFGNFVANLMDVTQGNRESNQRFGQARQNLGITSDFLGESRNGQRLFLPGDIAQANADVQAEMVRLQQQETDAKKQATAATSDAIAVLNREVTAIQAESGARVRLLQDLQTAAVPGRQAGQLANFARGAEPAIATPETRRYLAGLQAEQAVNTEQVAVRARRSPQGAVRGQLVQDVQAAQAAYQGLVAQQDRMTSGTQNEQAAQVRALDASRQRVAEAEHLVELYDRQKAGADALAAAESAITFINVARGQAQSGIDALQINQRSRLYNIDQSGIAPADAIAQAHIRVLQAQQEMAPLQLRQLDIQHEISVAGRTNVENQQNLLAAQLDSLAATERMEDIEHGLNANRAEAAALTARQLQGERVDPGQFVSLMRNTRDLVLQRAIAGPAAEQARYNVTLAQRPVTRDQLAAQQRVLGYQEEQRAIEDATFAAQRKETVAQQEADDIQRRVDIEKAEDQPIETIYQRSLVIADAWKLAADNAQRWAQFIQAGGQVGQNPLELAAAQLQGQQQLGVGAGNVGATQARSVPQFMARGLDYGPGSGAGIVANYGAAVLNGGARGAPADAAAAVPLVTAAPPGAAGVPVVGTPPPGAGGGVNVTVNMPGAVINSMADIERAAQNAASKTYEQTKSALIQAFGESPGGTVNPSLTGAAGG